MGVNIFSHYQTLSALSPVSGHFFLLYLEPKVSRNGRKRIFLIPDIFCRFSCFQTLFSVISKTKSVQKWEKTFLPFLDTFVVSPVSRQFFSYFQSHRHHGHYRHHCHRRHYKYITNTVRSLGKIHVIMFEKTSVSWCLLAP